MLGSPGSKVGSFLCTAERVAPKSEEEFAAEEFAPGPEIAGVVLDACPRVFGVVDTPEINAFAAPGGCVIVTRGLYEILATDSEHEALYKTHPPLDARSMILAKRGVPEGTVSSEEEPTE